MVFYFILMKNGNTKSKIENIFGLLDSFACEVNALHACIKMVVVLWTYLKVGSIKSLEFYDGAHQGM